jgi:hypothetical protein
MIQHLDPQDLTGLFQAAGDLPVFAAVGRVAGGVVVDEDQRSG